MRIYKKNFTVTDGTRCNGRYRPPKPAYLSLMVGHMRIILHALSYPQVPSDQIHGEYMSYPWFEKSSTVTDGTECIFPKCTF